MDNDKKIERIYTVNLSDAYEYTRTKRAIRTVKILREFIARHMKVEPQEVKISSTVNSYLWRDSIQRPPRKVKVKVVKDAQQVTVSMHDEEKTTAIKEQKKKIKEEKKKKTTKKQDAPKIEQKTAQKKPQTEKQKDKPKENKKE